MAWLPTQFPGVRVGTEVPGGDSFTTAVANGFVRVTRIGGGRNFALESPTVVLDSFRANRVDAKRFALSVVDAMFWRLPGVMIGGAVVTKVTEVSGASWAPWDDTDVRRFVSTVQIHLKNA